jgi:hypothetical protein
MQRSSAPKNSEKELIALCEQQVKKVKLTLEENLNKREQLKRVEGEDLEK